MDKIHDFHAHIYFDPEQVEMARALGEATLARFPSVQMGKIHLKPVGPHPRGSYQLTVSLQDFAELTCWFLDSRGPLTIFMHANTGEDLLDHTAHVIWLGLSEHLALDAL